MLYMPGSNARALEKAKSIPADALILDLEDAVAPDAKAAARDQVCAAVGAGGYGKREVIVRINGLDTGWGHEDVPAVAKSGADAVLLPKAETPDQLFHLDSLLRQWEGPEEQAIMAMIETPLGVLHVEEIAREAPRLTCLVMGTSDLVKDLHAQDTSDRVAMLPSLGLALLAARGYGLAIVDGVHLDLDDDAGLEAACAQGRAMGFDGKTLIHPKQVDAANRAFAPSADAVAWSRRIIAAHAAAEKKGAGVVLVDGRLIENLHVEEARRQVALARAIAALEGAAA
jgi:citrate lyase subunit beta/citryl-CoA lyase